MPNYELLEYPQRIERSILIATNASEVWRYLTVPAFMKEWMGDDYYYKDVRTHLKIQFQFEPNPESK